MIWKMKNGHSRLNHVITGGLLTLLLVFCSLFFTSKCWAETLPANNSQFFLNDGTRTQFYPYTASFTGVLNSPSGSYNTAKGASVSVYNQPNYGVRRANIYTQRFNATANSAVIHGEYNIVCSTRGYSSNCGMYNLDNLTVSYVSIDDSSGPTILTSNVSSFVTDWQETVNIGGVNYTYTNKTLTLYYDFAFKGITTASHYLSFRLGNTDAPIIYFYQTTGTGANDIFIYPEKMTAEISFFSSESDAINQATNNILETQNQILTYQYELQMAQEQRELEDRLNIQNISSGSSTDGNSASTNAENATSSLLGAITSIYGTLLHPHITDCNIGPLNVYEMQLGTLNFCQQPYGALPGINAIGALLMVGLVILLAWSVLKAGLSLYKDLFGGK